MRTSCVGNTTLHNADAQELLRRNGGSITKGKKQRQSIKKNLLLMHLSCILVICITIYRVNMYNFIQSIHICFVFVEEGGAIGFLWDDSAYH